MKGGTATIRDPSRLDFWLLSFSQDEALAGMETLSAVIPPPGATLCAGCRRLLDAFSTAVHEVMRLNEKHLLAVLANDPEPHRFELLIHAANEVKQNAKYAYLQHREVHGWSEGQNNEID
jgi:hypothetical protein